MLLVALLGCAFALLLRWLVIRPIGDLPRVTKLIADGDLTVSAPRLEVRDEIGQMARAFNQMVASQRDLVRQIVDTALALNTAASEFLAAAEQQERGAVEQASAADEYSRTIQTLLESARHIAETVQAVLQNAEKTQSNSQLVAERIAELASHSRRISEILQIIRDIANKSDLLALNAALEGTKAGEAGRGFSLVARQMQRLAENVMDAVKDIKELTETIGGATRSTVLATEDSNKLSADTTRSARQIALVVQQQQAGTEQATRAMDEVAQVARETASGTKQVVTSARDLLKLSEQLRELVGRFTLESGGSRGRPPLPAPPRKTGG